MWLPATKVARISLKCNNGYFIVRGPIRYSKEGQLGEPSLEKLLFEQFLGRKRCRIDIMVNDTRSEIWLKEGEPVAVRTGFKYAELTRLIAQTQKMKESKLEAIADEAIAAGIPLGDYLLGKGVVNRREYDRAVIGSILRKIGKLTTLHKGTWGIKYDYKDRIPVVSRRINIYMLLYFIHRHFKRASEYNTLRAAMNGKLLIPDKMFQSLVSQMEIPVHIKQVLRKMRAPFGYREIYKMGKLEKVEVIALVGMLLAVEGLAVIETPQAPESGMIPLPKHGELSHPSDILPSPQAEVAAHQTESMDMILFHLRTNVDLSQKDKNYLNQFKTMYDRIGKRSARMILGVTETTGQDWIKESYARKLEWFNPDEIPNTHFKALFPFLEEIRKSLKEALLEVLIQ